MGRNTEVLQSPWCDPSALGEEKGTRDSQHMQVALPCLLFFGIKPAPIF